MLGRRSAARCCALAAAGLLAGCGTQLHGTESGAAVATTSPSAVPTASANTGGSGHGYAGPLPSLDPTCASTSEVTIAPGRPPNDKLPGYGFGSGPAYLAGQTVLSHAMWFAGGQRADLVVAPSYSGAVTVTGHQLGGSGRAAFDLYDSVVIPPRPPAAYWRYWTGVLSFNQSGCYQLDFKGTGVDETVVVQAAAGRPPPG